MDTKWITWHCLEAWSISTNFNVTNKLSLKKLCVKKKLITTKIDVFDLLQQVGFYDPKCWWRLQKAEDCYKKVTKIKLVKAF